MSNISVEALYIYPLKSGRAIALTQMDIGTDGPLFDRSWMVVSADAKKAGRFLSQRDKGCAKLALVSARPDMLGNLTVSAPGAGSLQIPAYLTGQAMPVNVWNNPCSGLDCGDEAARWFSDYLSQPCRLVRKDPDVPRQVDTNYAADGTHVQFADGFPFLFTNTASLEALQPHFDDAANITMQRFRPNIVLSGLDAFAEDRIAELSVGGLRFAFVKPCARCVLTTVDQQTGIAPSQEPVATLSKLRRGKGDGLQGIFFGQNAICENLGSIKVGDAAEVLRTGTPHPAVRGCKLNAG